MKPGFAGWGQRFVVGSWLDVTERREAEEALRESELRHRLARMDAYISKTIRAALLVEVIEEARVGARRKAIEGGRVRLVQ